MYHPDIHRRRSIRLKHYDYSSAGAYFVTIGTKNRECLFGEVSDGQIVLIDAGRVADKCWYDIAAHFSHVELDACIIMPNHVHGIITIVGAGLALPKSNQGAASSAPTLGDIIRVFKSISSIKVNGILGRTGISLWQRNYYEHIIRNDVELNLGRIVTYKR